MTRKLSYRADIDGLRAVAVLAVIAAHLPENFLPSGFLGVDVFFAISGFVVTASLLNQQRTELARLYVGFLSRRVKRLLPALAVCVAATVVVVLATDPFPQHSVQTGLAALFGFANVVLFFFELDYFSPSSIFNAFTHTWSLGVEEQFYVVFPMFAWFFYFRTKTDSFKALAGAMIVGGLVSVVLFAWLYEDHQAAAFFLMPTRIWELGVGALVFLGTRRRQSGPLQEIFRRLSPFALVALIACFFVPESYAMPRHVGSRWIDGIAAGLRRSLPGCAPADAATRRLHRENFLFSLPVALADYRPWPDRAGNCVAIFGRVRSCHGDRRRHFLSLGRKTLAIQSLDDSPGTGHWIGAGL